MKRFPPLLLVLLLPVVGCSKETWPPSDEAVQAMNRGIARLEKFEYLPASVEFEKAVELCPEWVDAKVNLAISW
ncbi:MAG: hypothetical protein ACYTDY_17455, partial [Planctomycetota bacterium]